MIRILVVDDETHIRDAVCEILTDANYRILQAENGKAAKDILALQTVDLVISDIHMPGLTGLELLEWSRNHRPVPFIIITGFSTLMASKSAADSGAKQFLIKPFARPELLTAVESAVGLPGTKPAPAVADPVPEYGKVHIDEFIARPSAEFDIFVKLNDEKYVKVVQKGDTFDRDRLTTYKLKGVEHLHIQKEDLPKLLRFNLEIAGALKSAKTISKEKKLNFMRYTGDVLMEKAFIEGIDKQSLHDAREFLMLTMDLISDSDECVDLLNLLAAHSHWIYAESVGTALYSVMLSKKTGFESTGTYFKLSMAGLFHDIGYKEIDQSILEKPRHLLTTEERKLIESHVIRGQDILMAMRATPDDIIQLVGEHHEDLVGSGFPAAKTKFQLHPLSPILQAANLFVDLVVPRPNHTEKTKPEAIAYMERIYQNRVDPKYLRALKSLVGV